MDAMVLLRLCEQLSFLKVWAHQARFSEQDSHKDTKLVVFGSLQAVNAHSGRESPKKVVLDAIDMDAIQKLVFGITSGIQNLVTPGSVFNFLVKRWLWLGF